MFRHAGQPALGLICATGHLSYAGVGTFNLSQSVDQENLNVLGQIKETRRCGCHARLIHRVYLVVMGATEIEL